MRRAWECVCVLRVAERWGCDGCGGVWRGWLAWGWSGGKEAGRGGAEARQMEGGREEGGMEGSGWRF